MASAAFDDDDAITGINITPLVDIILVLLIIFMMTASYTVAPAIRVDLPRASTAEPVAQTGTLSIVLARDGTVYLDGQPAGEDEVRRRIRAGRAEGRELRAVIAADAAVTHGRVVKLIDLVQAEGVVGFALSTETELPGG
jgi:biopolymer transport protein ExbD